MNRVANEQLRYAVRKGKIKKPNICSRCLQEFSVNKIQGHHEDYDKPLDVIWFCASCHNLYEIEKGRPRRINSLFKNGSDSRRNIKGKNQYWSGDIRFLNRWAIKFDKCISCGT